jgi:predicted RNA-binding protein Jag
MKSIVEEASSVLKAIEKGWSLAGKPQEFTIKIFEVEQKNFLGMSVKPAKIAIFFGEKVAEKAQHRTADYADKKNSTQPKPREKTQRPVTTSTHPAARRPIEQQAPQQPRPLRTPEEKKEPSLATRQQWTDEMVAAADQWLKETLALMKESDKKFNLEVKNYYLKINFDDTFFGNIERERILFRSFAYLLMQSLRNKFKKGLRGFKVILTSKNS